MVFVIDMSFVVGGCLMMDVDKSFVVIVEFNCII